MEQQRKLWWKFVLALKTEKGVLPPLEELRDEVSSNAQTNFSKMKISVKFLV